jgi:hypothetical protein
MNADAAGKDYVDAQLLQVGADVGGQLVNGHVADGLHNGLPGRQGRRRFMITASCS